MEHSFSVPTSEFIKTVKSLSTLLKSIKLKPDDPMLIVDVKTEAIELQLIGMSREIKIENKDAFSFVVPLNAFTWFLSDSRESDLTVTLFGNQITVHNRTFTSPHLRLLKEDEKKKIAINMNPTVLQILSLRYKNTEAELKQWNYLDLLVKTEAQLSNDINAAVRVLINYGVKKSEIEKIILDRINMSLH